jgi:outer membrane biosynthesis protein TonB
MSGKVEAQKPEPIQIELIQPAEAQEPTVFSQLPEDRAAKKPEHADVLSNVTSRAADRVPGGAESMPRMEGSADMPLVALRPGQNAPTPPSNARDARDPVDGRESNQEQGVSLGNRRRREFATENEMVRRAHENALLLARPEGGADFFQPEMAAPGGNATSFGDISLNTTAWDYAPWLERFRRALMQHWYAPGAYYYGVLREGGYAVIEVVIAKSGEMNHMDLLDEKEHPSFTAASMEALKSTAPFEALPKDFPEPTLILRIQMIYPKIERR